MTRLIRTAALTLVLCALPTSILPGQAKPVAPLDSQHLALGRRLLTAMHLEKLMIAAFQSSLPEERAKGEMPPVFWDSLESRVRQRSGDLVDSLVPIYAGRFSPPELLELIRFYESPLGQRYADMWPEFAEASDAVTQRWGMRLTADVFKDLVDQGVDFGDD